jgi:WD40 repeat protein
MSVNGIVKIWDLAQGELVRDIQAGKGRVLALAFLANGHVLATGGYDSVLRLWDVDSGELLQKLEGLPPDPTHFNRTPIGTVAISPDGTKIAAGFGNPLFHLSDYKQVVKVWDLSSGKLLKELPGHFNTICSVAFSPDGKVLATASDDQQVKLWSVGDWQPIGMLPATERFKSVTFSPAGQWIVTGGESGAITIWDTTSRRPLRPLTGHTNAVQRLMFSPDGRTLASASWDETVKLWDPITGRETRTLRDHTEWISCLAFSPDGNVLATGSFDRTVRLWDVASAEVIAATLAADRAIAERQQTRYRARRQQRAADGTFTVAATLLEQYAGRYDDGLIVDRQDDHLSIYPIKGARGAIVPLYPQSDQVFICRDREVDVTFLRDEYGQVTRVIVYQAGEAFEAKKQIHSEQVGPTTVKP